MRKLNNKGMTTVEILVSFVLVAIISSSLYTSVTNYNNKRKLESTKLQINTYKNLLTKDIQDDLIKNGLVAAHITEGTYEKDGYQNADLYQVDLELKDHSKRRLVVIRQLAQFYLKNKDGESSGLESEKNNVDDKFTIYYGTPNDNLIGGLEEYPIPDVGFGYNEDHKKVKDLRLINVLINDINGTLSIFLGFQHIDEGTKYAINIVCPINFEI